MVGEALNFLYMLLLDENFCSQSGSRAGPRTVSPQIVDSRNGGSRQPPPRVHTAADYRIRHKFPNAKYADAIRQLQISGKRTFQQIPKSHTVNSFTRVNSLFLTPTLFHLHSDYFC